MISMPYRKIIVLERRDRSLLMNLGGLVTIASAAPRRASQDRSPFRL
jgi:hypothetical protein